MKATQPRFVGVELYFENLDKAKKFYVETLGLNVSMSNTGTMQNSIMEQVSR